MVKDQLTISNETGLHTRPAKRVVTEAKQFECDITLIFGEKEANVKSLLKLMKLGISKDSKVEIVCDGSDEVAALAHIKNFLANLED